MKILVAVILVTSLVACKNNETTNVTTKADSVSNYVSKQLEGYATVRLTADLTNVSDSDKQAIPLLIEAAKVMDSLFWLQTFGNPDSLLNSMNDQGAKRFIEINYG